MSDKAQSIDFRDRFKRAVLKIKKLNAELEQHTLAKSEPIAIVGLGCRFPGGSNNPDAYWKMLKSGEDGVVQVPNDRWGPDEAPTTFEDNDAVRGTRWGGFLTSPLTDFDPAFFGISPREARSLDPQQRLLLEVAWEALESANIPPERLFGSKTGVFVGMSSQDYTQHATSQSRDDLSVYDTTGNMFSIAGGRLSYVLGLQGPNVTLDTACSSSLVSVHLAVQSLRRGESDVALAGGVNLILSPTTMLMLARTGALSPDGRCKAFDASANGFVRGEGCGLVVLKRLRDAQADGDDIWAVIKGSAVNQDGRSTGLTAPNVLSQKSLLKQALDNAQISPEEITYIEAHGTGTSLGDPIEVDALKSVIGAPRESGSCLLSSVKSNIGHLEAAAGIAGLIKIVLSLRHGEIPAQLHFKRLNPRISLDNTPLYVSSEHTPWRRGEGPRNAGVSGFGLSGTNAHVILGEAPLPDAPEASAPALPERDQHLALISARSEAGLALQAERLKGSDALDGDLGDLAHTLAKGRSHFDHRAALIAKDSAGLKAGLERIIEGRNSPMVVKGSVLKGATKPKVAFLFTGQGSQYAGMGQSLYASHPPFKAAFDEAAAAVSVHLGRDLKDVVFPAEGAESPINDTAFTQPALFAIEYALAKTWANLGLTPDVVMGHSVGEFAASVIAGVMTLEDGARLIVERGRRMQALPRDGAMAALKLTPEQAEAAIEAFKDDVSIAAYNGPTSVVISGRTEAVKAICGALKEEGIKAKELVVSHAFHSQLMEPMLAGFEAVAKGMSLSKPTIPLLSNLTGELAGDEITTPRYWRDHVRSAVRFAPGMKALEEMGCRIFIEIGPSPVLLGMGTACVDTKDGHWLPSLRKGKSDWQIFLKSVGSLHVLGQKLNLDAIDEGHPRAMVQLPTYAFDRKRYWIERTKGQGLNAGEMPHPLLGQRDGASEHPAFSQVISSEQPAYLKDHVVMGQVVFPAAAYWEMARAMAEALFGPGAHGVEDVVLQEALILPPQESRTLRIALKAPLSGSTPVELTSTDDQGGAAIVHATATLTRGSANNNDATPKADLPALRALCNAPWDAESIYGQFEAVGLTYGPTFQGLRSASTGGETGQSDALAEVKLPEGTITQGYGIHPALLDAALQTLATLIAQGATTDDGSPADAFLPFALESFRVYGDIGAEALAHAHLSPSKPGADVLSGDVTLMDDEGQILAEVKALRVKRIDRAALKRGENRRAERWVHAIDWQALAPVSERPDSGRYVILEDSSGVGAALKGALQGAGAEVITLKKGDSPGLDAGLKSALSGGPIKGVVNLWALDIPKALKSDVLTPQEGLAEAAIELTLTLTRNAGSKPPKVWWITRGAQALEGEEPNPNQATLWGIGRVAALEHPESRAVLLDLDAAEGSTPAKAAAALLNELAAQDDEAQVLFRGGKRLGARLLPSRPGLKSGRLAIPASESYRLEIPQRGSFNSLIINDVPRPAMEAGQVEIEVRASGLNFRDVLNVLGMYPGDPGPLGAEASGVVSAIGAGVENVAIGDEVLAMGPASHGRFLITDHRYLAKKPANLSWEDAATLPVAFLTAYYALHELGKLQKGERILIHAAAGGVGMAAVQLAQWMGAEVFGTASTPKWDTLKAMGVEHIHNSRTLDFAAEISEATKGAGVNMVLNALTGEFITKSMNLLAEGGRFLEMGKAEIWTDEQVKGFKSGVTYDAFDLSVVDGDIIKTMFDTLMDAFAAGHLRPLPKKVYPLSAAKDAFRFMAQAKHIGKLILANDVTCPQGEVDAPRLRNHGTYLVTGGMGALGLEVAKWLADEGAKHITLMGRSAPKAGAQAVIDDLKAKGVTVAIGLCDVADEAGLKAAIGEQAIAGVIHAAGVLDDGPLIQQTWPRFRKVMGPKIPGALNLHRLTSGQDLDHFVLFSSAASLLGSPGQSNYAAANAYLDSLAQLRRSQGLPGVSIGWGGWAQGGMAQDVDERVRAQWATQGITQIQVSQGLHLLGEIIKGDAPHVGVLPITWKKMAATLPMVPSILREVMPQDSEEEKSEDAGGTAARDALIGRLRKTDPEERQEVVRDVLREHVANVLGLSDPSEVEPTQPLAEMGMDSLMAVELRNVMSETVGQTLPATLVFDYPTLEGISQHVLAEYLSVDDEPDVIAPVAAMQARVGDPLEPIAVIGIGCRFAGGVESPDTFWELLKEGRNGITEVPASRWDIDSYYDPDIWAAGKMYTRHGGFVDNVDQFEPSFFGMIKREAESMDPQQRLLLEVAWEALEHAAIPPKSLMGSETGVFVGICSNDYGDEAMGKITNFNAYSGTGNFGSVASGRISYLLGLRGPSIALDTACSSSLVSIHLACQSLRSGESNLALAGGVNLILSPNGTLYFSKIQALAPDGKTKAFDAAANGYVRAEGCGLIVLKRLSDAQRDGDRILALVKGSAVNQDGRSNGLTAPNGPAQQQVVRRALANAGVAPQEISYVEAHGTGTPLGDPIELQALGTVLKAGRDPESKVLVGTVKTNFGHSEGAAGVAGVIKTILSLQGEMIPRNLHFQSPSPHIPWASLPLKVATEPTPWKRSDGRRVAGVSSFGLSGTNAHVILEEAPLQEAPEPQDVHTHIALLSGRKEKVLGQVASRLAAHLEAHPEQSLGEVCRTLATGRVHHGARLALPVTSRDALLNAMKALGSGAPYPGVIRGKVEAAQARGKVALAFGAKVPMGGEDARDLYALEPAFAEAVDACLSGDSTLDSLLGQGGALRAFALQLATARLYQSWGVEVEGAIGDGVGLWTGAVIMGAINLEDALSHLSGKDIDEGALKGQLDAIVQGRSENKASPRIFAGAGGGENLGVSSDALMSALVSALGGAGSGQAGAKALEGLKASGIDVLLGVGAGIGSAGEAGGLMVLGESAAGSINRGALLMGLAQLHVLGKVVDWGAVYAPLGTQRVSLPTYPFQRKRYWL